MADNRQWQLERDELLRTLHSLEQENGNLLNENAWLHEQLEKRELQIRKAGSLAEASVQLSGVLNAAQETADVYLENIQRLAEEQKAWTKQKLVATKQLCLTYAQQTEKLCGKRGGQSLTQQVEALFWKSPQKKNGS